MYYKDCEDYIGTLYCPPKQMIADSMPKLVMERLFKGTNTKYQGVKFQFVPEVHRVVLSAKTEEEIKDLMSNCDSKVTYILIKKNCQLIQTFITVSPVLAESLLSIEIGTVLGKSAYVETCISPGYYSHLLEQFTNLEVIRFYNVSLPHCLSILGNLRAYQFIKVIEQTADKIENDQIVLKGPATLNIQCGMNAFEVSFTEEATLFTPKETSLPSSKDPQTPIIGIEAIGDVKIDPQVCLRPSPSPHHLCKFPDTTITQICKSCLTASQIPKLCEENLHPNLQFSTSFETVDEIKGYLGKVRFKEITVEWTENFECLLPGSVEELNLVHNESVVVMVRVGKQVECQITSGVHGLVEIRVTKG